MVAGVSVFNAVKVTWLVLLWGHWNDLCELVWKLYKVNCMSIKNDIGSEIFFTSKSVIMWW